MIESPGLRSLHSAAKDALILALIERVNALTAEKAELKERPAAEVAALQNCRRSSTCRRKGRRVVGR